MKCRGKWICRLDDGKTRFRADSRARKRRFARNARFFAVPPRRSAAGCKPPKAISMRHQSHILGIYSGVQGHLKATSKPPQGYPKATPNRKLPMADRRWPMPNRKRQAKGKAANINLAGWCRTAVPGPISIIRSFISGFIPNTVSFNRLGIPSACFRLFPRLLLATESQLP
jgi:hypothetical protein